MVSFDMPLSARSGRAATPLPASADPDLIAQFDARVERMFALLDGVVAGRADVADLRHALHQVAGTAAFFGKRELGTVASTLDRELGEVSGAIRALLADAGTALRHAALGDG